MDRHADAARLLLSARRDPSQPLRALPDAVAPKTTEQAVGIQRAIMAELGEIGGWKVGRPNPQGACNCSPLPAAGIKESPATVTDCPMRGVEAEIAVRMARDLPPREAPYGREEVLAAIGSAHPAIEVLHSRFADPDAQDALANLADSLSHGGFVWGRAKQGWQEVDLATESVRLLVDGEEIKRRTGNPAGDMIELLVWMANEGARWAGGLRAGQFVTTGSWTAKDFVPAGARVEVVFDRMGTAEVSLQD